MTDETNAAETYVPDAAPETPKRRTRKADTAPDVVPVDDVFAGYAPTVVPGSRTELPSGLVIETF